MEVQTLKIKLFELLLTKRPILLCFNIFKTKSYLIYIYINTVGKTIKFNLKHYNTFLPTHQLSRKYKKLMSGLALMPKHTT